MDQRESLTSGALTPLAADTASSAPTPAAGDIFSFCGQNFCLNGKPFQIRSGEMHPARIPEQYWQHRIQMARAMGMNTISLYMMWNYHEERLGVFDFRTDRRDIAKFITLCQQEKMYVLLRPGPYICGEWDFGGLPPYLLSNKEIKLRTFSDPNYKSAVTRYINQLAPVIKPLMLINGGPILMVQIENEYGDYCTEKDTSGYLPGLRQIWTNAGIKGPFYTEDGLDPLKTYETNVPSGAIGLSYRNESITQLIKDCREAFPKVPAMVGELYPGWFTWWGNNEFAKSNDIFSKLKELLDNKLSFNLYPLHGGTSFGYWAGANTEDSGHYHPDITSYDYGSPITEQGRPTREYMVYRELIIRYVGQLPPVPAPIPTIVRTGSQAFSPVAYASLWDNLPDPLPADQTVNPQPMEIYGQNSGFMLYRRALTGYTNTATLTITEVHDYATVFLDGTYQGGISRPPLPDTYPKSLNMKNSSTLKLGQAGSNPTLDILVEGMGRTNCGHANVFVDRKGITGQVSLTPGGPLTHWDTYTLPVDEAYVARLKPLTSTSNLNRPGIFFLATVTLDQIGDTYVDMSRWAKGVVWVNGHNLGRYWSIGPQQRLYCPAPWLAKGPNKILVLDLHQTQPQPITLEASLTDMSDTCYGPYSALVKGSGGWSSENNRTQLFLQDDGNLVLYVDSKAVWATNTRNGSYLSMQSNGNLVLYTTVTDEKNAKEDGQVGHDPIWQSNTAGNPRSSVYVQDDGHLVIRKPDGTPIASYPQI